MGDILRKDTTDITQLVEINTGLSLTLSEDYEAKDEGLKRIRSETPKVSRNNVPLIADVLPRTGSIAGGQLLTIVGSNFASQNLNIAGLMEDSSVIDDGEELS